MATSVKATKDNSSITLSINSISVTRNKTSYTVTCGWSTSGSANYAAAEINDHEVHRDGYSSGDNRKSQTDSGTYSFTVSTDNRRAFTATFTIKASARDVHGGSWASKTESCEAEVPSLAPNLLIKISGEWVECDAVFIKVNGGWVEADAVHVKENGTWQEA